MPFQPELPFEPSLPPLTEATTGAPRKFLAGVTLGAVLAGGTMAGLISYQNDDRRVKAQANELVADQKTIDRLGRLVGGLSDVSPDTALGTNLRSVESLPGYGETVSNSIAEAMRRATVKIYAQDKTGRANWYENCTGLVVSSEGKKYIATAAHCLAMPPVKGGDGLWNKGGPITDAGNVTGVLPQKYAVRPVTTGVLQGPFSPVAAISKSTTEDWVLMRLDEKLESPAVAAITPIDYDQYLHPSNDKRPVVGQSVEVFSEPSASSGKLVSGRGIYLGIAQQRSSYNTSNVMLVGLSNVDSPEEDACNFGASGSTAVLADGTITGPLSTRQIVTYPKSKASQPGDIDSANGTKERLRLEEHFGLDLSRFTTICGYTIPNLETVVSLKQGFDNVVSGYPISPYQGK